MTFAVITLALSATSFAAVAVAFAIRNGTLTASIAALRSALKTSEAERDETRDEFERYQRRAAKQQEALRDDINDLEDMLANFDDPGAVRERFERLLQKASRSPGDEGGDGLP